MNSPVSDRFISITIPFRFQILQLLKEPESFQFIYIAFSSRRLISIYVLPVGVTAFKSGDYGKAIKEFQQATDEDDQNHKAWNALGVVLTKTGQYEDADTCYANALKVVPGIPTYQKNRNINRKKWHAGDVLEVEDDAAVPFRKETPTNAAKTYNSGFQITGRPWWQYFIGVFAILFILMLLGAAAGGGGESKSHINTPIKNPIKNSDSSSKGTIEILGINRTPSGKIYPIKNVGSTPVTGSLVIREYDEDHNLIEYLSGDFSDLAPNQIISVKIPSPQKEDIASYWTLNAVPSTINTTGYGPRVIPPPIKLSTQSQNSGKSENLDFSGKNGQSTRMFYLDKGLAEFRYSYSGKGNFIVHLCDNAGDIVGYIANEQNSCYGNKREGIKNEGNYYLDIRSHGDWNISISQ